MVKKDLITQKVKIRKCITFIAIIISIAFIASLMMENTRAVVSASTPEPTTLPQSSPSPNSTFAFAYETEGTEWSGLIAPKTYTLCNYTTSNDTGILIMQISIFLKGTHEGSQVKAVIFPNEPEAEFPKDGEPLAQSIGTLNVTSVSGEWYNFTMNYHASPNTTYWFGYFSDNSTQVVFDANNEHLLVTSQPKDGNSQWLPVRWSYQGKSIMSLYVSYIIVETPSPTPVQQYSESGSFQDICFVLIIMGAEFTIIITDQNRKNKNTIRL